MYVKFILNNEIDGNFYHFYFDEPNILFIGYKDKEESKIKIIQLNEYEIKNFI